MRPNLTGLTPPEAYAVGHQRGMSFVLEAIKEMQHDEPLDWDDLDLIVRELIRNAETRHPALEIEHMHMILRDGTCSVCGKQVMGPDRE